MPIYLIRYTFSSPSSAALPPHPHSHVLITLLRRPLSCSTYVPFPCLSLVCVTTLFRYQSPRSHLLFHCHPPSSKAICFAIVCLPPPPSLSPSATRSPLSHTSLVSHSSSSLLSPPISAPQQPHSHC